MNLMPELPEVETIKRGLAKRIVGKTIRDLEVRYPKTFQGDKMEVEGHKVEGLKRRAKVLAIKLDNNFNLLFHLKMTGQLIYKQESGETNQELRAKGEDYFAGGHPDHEWHAKLPDKTTALVFHFNDDSVLFFNDMRKFGWCKVLTNDELEKLFKDEYGPEPFDQEFNYEYLIRQAAKIPNRNAKQFLTDQSIIAGIGNIYVDEALFDARISPLRKVKDISLSEWKKIIESVKKVLEMGIEFGGTTDSDYVNAEGKKGGMQDHLKVYHKTGEPCSGDCGGVVERITVGGRGTHYCQNCQK